jgi:Ion channel
MRYPPLLIALFIAMLLKPVTEHFGSYDLSGGMFLLLVFLTVIYAFRHIRRLAICLTILAAISVTLRFAADLRSLTNLEIISQASALIAMILVVRAILSEVLRARTASTDMVIGAVCLYLVIGLAWTFLYYSMYLLAPGSIFVSPGQITVVASESKFAEVMYFSLSAMTTIGSSGEHPLTVMARQLAVVESAMGQLYLAVLVSRLVGFHTASHTKAD